MMSAYMAETNTTGVCNNFRVSGSFCGLPFYFSTFYRVGTVHDELRVIAERIEVLSNKDLCAPQVRIA